MTPPPHFDEPQRDIAVGMLNSAIVAAERDTLSEDVAKSIISYLASRVDCFAFIYYLDLCRQTTQDKKLDSSSAVTDLIVSILTSDLRETVEAKIERLSDEEFEFFLDKIAQGDIVVMDRAYASCILARIYEKNMLTKQTFFALMIEGLRTPQTLTELLGVIAGDGGPFGFESLLRSFLGHVDASNKGNDEDGADGEPEENHDDKNGGGCCGGCCGGCHGGCGGCGHCGKSDDESSE